MCGLAGIVRRGGLRSARKSAVHSIDEYKLIELAEARLASLVMDCRVSPQVSWLAL